MIKRDQYSAIKSGLFKGKVIILYGPRQVGKTTLIRQLMEEVASAVYLNCDEIDIRTILENKTSTELKEIFKLSKLVVIDEAQRVKNIGLTLKLIHDTFPEIQVIATGSSSFDLSNALMEPLTGRKKEYLLYPIAINELHHSLTGIEIKRLLDTYLTYGMYPDVINTPLVEKEAVLNELTKSYLYKDILAFSNIKNSDNLERLLQAIALQLGNEVSYTELASTVGIDKNTVANYIDILEKAFIIFRLRPLGRNQRKGLTRLRKIYFYDVGIRNSLIKNFNAMHLRNDVGNLWENFVIAERLKRNCINAYSSNLSFWRHSSGVEIDYIEERNNFFNAYEIKWTADKMKAPKKYLSIYSNSEVTLINKDNFLTFVTSL